MEASLPLWVRNMSVSFYNALNIILLYVTEIATQTCRACSIKSTLGTNSKNDTERPNAEAKVAGCSFFSRLSCSGGEGADFADYMEDYGRILTEIYG